MLVTLLAAQPVVYKLISPRYWGGGQSFPCNLTSPAWFFRHPEQAILDYVSAIYDVKLELQDGSFSPKLQKLVYMPAKDVSDLEESWMTFAELEELVRTSSRLIECVTGIPGTSGRAIPGRVRNPPI